MGTLVANSGRVIIVGDGFAGKLAALRLSREREVILLSNPRVRHGVAPSDERPVGKPAHSHIFLPRLMVELEAMAPEVLEALAKRGLSFGPGASGLRRNLAPNAKRMFAMRWQVDAALNDCLAEHFNGRIEPFAVGALTTGESEHGPVISAVEPVLDEAPIAIQPDDLVIDATGAQQMLIERIIGGTGLQNRLLTRRKSHMSYMSQFFRLNEGVDRDTLAEPLFACSVNYGQVYITLYPGGDGWFSLTVAHDMRNAETRAQVRTTDDVLSYALESEGLASWVTQATPVGRPTVYLNPQNSWAVKLFVERQAPLNYFAVGDALVTTNPALGAGCSFAATHVRVLADVLDQGIADPRNLMQAFGQAIAAEQLWFFRAAVKAQPPNAPRQAPQSSRIVGRPRRMLKVLARDSSLRDNS